MKLVVFFWFFILSSSQFLSAEPYVKGHYYTYKGEKIEGFVRLLRSTFSALGSLPCRLQFKEDHDSKAIKLSVNDMVAFVIEEDSFALVYNLKINSIQGKYERDFAEVKFIGTINLYIHRSTSSDGRMVYFHNRYVLSKDNKEFLGIWNKKRQRNEIAAYFSDREDLRQIILNKKNEMDIESLVSEYNKTTIQ